MRCKLHSVPDSPLHPNLPSGCTAADPSLLLQVVWAVIVPWELLVFNLKPPSLLGHNALCILRTVVTVTV